MPVPRGVFVAEDSGRSLPPGVGALRAPLVVKALGEAIVHKSDVGALRLGVVGEEAVASAMREMRAGLRAQGLVPAGFLVEEMVEPGIELALGLVDDTAFGRLVAFGLGGTRVEALGEVRFFAPPLRPLDVDTVIASVPWLSAALGRGGEAGLSALRDLVWRFGGPGGIASDPSVERLELNPVVATARAVTAVDARGAMAS